VTERQDDQGENENSKDQKRGRHTYTPTVIEYERQEEMAMDNICHQREGDDGWIYFSMY